MASLTQGRWEISTFTQRVRVRQGYVVFLRDRYATPLYYEFLTPRKDDQ